MANDSNPAVTLAELLEQGLQKDPDLTAKQRRLLQMLNGSKRLQQAADSTTAGIDEFPSALPAANLRTDSASIETGEDGIKAEASHRAQVRQLVRAQPSRTPNQPK